MPVLSREQLRDTALARFEEAVKLAESSSFTTRAEWLGLSGGPTYTRAQLAGLMRTMGAELLAMMPRNGAESRQVDWARVASWASSGISTQPPFEFTFVSDWLNPALFDLGKAWSHDIVTMRVDTRVKR